MELDLEPLRLPSDNERPVVIAGPCSAETEEQVMSTARSLAAKGCHIFRAGIWKPRTKPGGFEGNGETALPWMKRVKEETGMLISTEVATPEHVELALKYGMDILWVGARTSANPFAMQALADAMQGLDLPVRRIPGLPIICDPSHIGGRRDLIAPLCQQAMDLGFDGLIVESHCNPEKAWSDAKQQVTPDILDYILSLLIVRDVHSTTEDLRLLRSQIDEVDNSLMGLLAKRFRICREIGTFKKEHNMTVLQAGRYNEILEKRGAQASLCGMDANFAAQVFELIHEESVRQQLEIVNQ